MKSTKRTKNAPRARKAARSIRSAKPAVAAASTRFSWATSSSAIVLGMIFVVAAAMLTAREDAPPPNVEREPLPPAPRTVERDASHPLAATKTVVAKTGTTGASELLSTTAASEPSPAAMNETVEPEPDRMASVTITGCLENDDEGAFRLIDASGADAPKSRSWKSGFLKKRPAPIDLEDAVGTLNLRNHVGRRVAATGTLNDREMRARAVRFIGACE